MLENGHRVLPKREQPRDWCGCALSGAGLRPGLWSCRQGLQRLRGRGRRQDAARAMEQARGGGAARTLRGGPSGDQRRPPDASLHGYAPVPGSGGLAVEEHGHRLGRGLPAQHLARPAVQPVSNILQVLRGVDGQVGALGEVLAQQPVGVLVGRPLPRESAGRRSRSRKSGATVNRSCWCISVPWSQVSDRRSAPGRPVITAVRASANASADFPPGSGTSIVNRVDRSTRVPICDLPPLPGDRVAFPVPGHRPLSGLRWPLGDHHHARDPPAPLAFLAPRLAQRPPGQQVPDQLSAQRPPALHISAW